MAVIRRWLQMSIEEGVPIQFETHRNCITNDLYTMLQLIEIIPEMRLVADLSHYVVDREMMQPIAAEYQAMMRSILSRSDSFQGRVATRNQVQVPIGFPQHRKWLDTFVDWWTFGLTEWKARAGVDDEVIFLSELGPREYAITDAEGEELSDRRQEALDSADRDGYLETHLRGWVSRKNVLTTSRLAVSCGGQKTAQRAAQ